MLTSPAKRGSLACPAPMTNRASVLQLYRSLLKAAKQMPTAARCDFVRKRARLDFKANKNLTDLEEIALQYTLGQTQLDNVTQQAAHLTNLLHQGILRIAPAYAAKCSRGPVLVLPGYLRDCTEYAPLVAELRARGFEAWAAPIRWYHWAPTVGGRSMRPILDRIHHAVTHLAHGIDHLDYETTTTTPEAPYGTVQFLQELGDASQGSAVPQLQHVSMRDAALGSMAPTPVRRVALVGHSASGWVSRLYLGASKPYGNRVYPGASLVHTLCMLGSPQYTSEGITSRNLAFVNDHAPLHAGVKYVAVASAAVAGRAYGPGNILQDFAYQSYELCCGPGTGGAIGDGVVPVQCATALPGAKTLILEDVWHNPTDEGKGRLWYGSPTVVDAWVGFLEEE